MAQSKSYRMNSFHVIMTAVTCLSVFLGLFILRLKKKRVQEFTVPVPPEASLDWKPDTVLSQPSISNPGKPEYIQCYDPSTFGYLGDVKCDTLESIEQKVGLARLAHQQWSKSSFDSRRALLSSLLDFIVLHHCDIIRVSMRDSGKTRMFLAAPFMTCRCGCVLW